MQRLRFGLVLLLLLWPVFTVRAEPHPLAQIPLFSFENNNVPDDIAAVVKRYWGQFYNRSGPKSFGPDSLRYGFTDLNNDGAQDLILVIEHPAWASGDGYVMLVGTWSKNLNRWLTIGWSWGDAETLFSTDEVISGWRTLDTGSQYLAWNGTIYKSRKKPSVTLK